MVIPPTDTRMRKHPRLHEELTGGRLPEATLDHIDAIMYCRRPEPFMDMVRDVAGEVKVALVTGT